METNRVHATDPGDWPRREDGRLGKRSRCSRADRCHSTSLATSPRRRTSGVRDAFTCVKQLGRFAARGGGAIATAGRSRQRGDRGVDVVHMTSCTGAGLSHEPPSRTYGSHRTLRPSRNRCPPPVKGPPACAGTAHARRCACAALRVYEPHRLPRIGRAFPTGACKAGPHSPLAVTSYFEVIHEAFAVL